MDLHTKLSDRFLDLENVKNAQALEIQKLKKRSLGDKENASKHRRNEIDQDEGIAWFQEDLETQGRYGHDIGVNTASISIITASINMTIAEPVTTASAPITTASVSVSTTEPSTPSTTTTTPIKDEDLTIAQTLIKMKSKKSKAKGVTMQDPSESGTRLVANGTPELVASIDNKEYTITEASVRSNLQLADASGISNLPDAKIYNGLATLGYVSEGITIENNGKYLAPTLTKKIFANMKRGYTEDYVPLLPAMLAGTAEDQGSSFTHVVDEATTTGVGVGTEGATTTTSGLDAGLDSGNIHESPLRSHKAPLHEGHTLGSAEDSLQLKELMVLVPKLVTRIANLEKELHQTKTTYGKVVLTLVERVKSLEVALKRKTKKVVMSDLEDEETDNQGRKIQDIDDDPLISLVREYMKEQDTDFVTPTKISALGEVQEQDISPTTLEAAKTLSQVISQKAKSTDKVNPGSEDFNTRNEDFNTGSLGVSTGSGPVSTPHVV
ncbi:hypothetical protein Tco_0624216 [Tanacetum coccineum]|uniref:Uncharacterized protein n=1 Tax=Tanacetum coccineum TaxID=301880 RepID=A0ABQ4WDC4_9ASTR